MRAAAMFGPIYLFLLVLLVFAQQFCAPGMTRLCLQPACSVLRFLWHYRASTNLTALRRLQKSICTATVLRSSVFWCYGLAQHGLSAPIPTSALSGKTVAESEGAFPLREVPYKYSWQPRLHCHVAGAPESMC